MTRDDFKKFCQLEIDFESIGLMEPGREQAPYFCTPMGAEHVGRTGCDCVHFILLPGDERVFCVEPSMGEPGTFVLPVGGDFREFLSFVLFCGGAGPLAQIFWLEEPRFRGLLKEDAEARWPGCEEHFAKKRVVFERIAQAFQLKAEDPYQRVKALQEAFDASALVFTQEYYDVLGMERE